MKTLHFILFLLLLACSNLFYSQIKIEPTMFGQAYWFTDNKAPTNGLDDLDPVTKWPAVVASGARLIRVGGSAYNSTVNPSANPDPLCLPDNPAEYVKIVDNIRKRGCE